MNFALSRLLSNSWGHCCVLAMQPVDCCGLLCSVRISVDASRCFLHRLPRLVGWLWQATAVSNFESTSTSLLFSYIKTIVFIHSFIHSFIHFMSFSFIHSFNFISFQFISFPFISFIHIIHIIHSFIHSFARSLIPFHSFIHSFIHHSFVSFYFISCHFISFHVI